MSSVFNYHLMLVVGTVVSLPGYQIFLLVLIWVRMMKFKCIKTRDGVYSIKPFQLLILQSEKNLPLYRKV